MKIHSNGLRFFLIALLFLLSIVLLIIGESAVEDTVSVWGLLILSASLFFALEESKKTDTPEFYIRIKETLSSTFSGEGWRIFFKTIKILLSVLFVIAGVIFFCKNEYYIGTVVFFLSLLFLIEELELQGLYIVYLPLLLIGSCITAYMEVSVGVSGFQSDVVFEELLPENGKVSNENAAPIHLKSFQLRENESPIYISVYPLSDSYIDLAIYDSDGQNLFWLEDYGLYKGTRRGPGNALVVEYCYDEPGLYHVKVKQLYSFNGPVKLEVFYTKWPQLLKIDKSNCP